MSTPYQHPIQKIVPYLPWAEKGLLIAFVVGVTLQYLEVETFGLILISVGGLAVVYFLRAFEPLEFPHEENERLGFKDLLVQTITPKILWISCAVTTIGFLFFAQSNPAYKQQIFIGLSSNAVATALITFAFIAGNKNIKVIAPILFRSLPILFVGLYLLLK